MGSREICPEQGESESCLIPAGLYHPWSNSNATYAAVVSQERFLTKRVVRGKKKSHEIGSEMVVLAYKSPSRCLVGIDDDRWEMNCPNPMSFSWLEPIELEMRDSKQFFQGTCRDGVKRWIPIENDMFNHPDIVMGELKEHGTVLHAQGVGK